MFPGTYQEHVCGMVVTALGCRGQRHCTALDFSYLFIYSCVLTGEDVDLFDMEQFQSSFKRILQRALKNVRIQAFLDFYEIQFNDIGGGGWGGGWR